MAYYTDFTDELYGPQQGKPPAGVTVTTGRSGPFRMTQVHITAEGLARPKGHYITLELPQGTQPDDRDEPAAQAIAAQLRPLLPASGLVLVVGVGNRRVTADALGPRTAGQILVTQELDPRWLHGPLALRPVASIAPGVAGLTGVPLSRLLAGLVRVIRPAAVLCVDSLCSQEPQRLGRTVQISDAGLCPSQPGSGRHITQAQLGVPVVAVGIPTLMDADGFADCGGLVLTPRELDPLIRRGSALLALGINWALQPGLTLPELRWLAN